MSTSVRITAIYALFGIVWIVLSDHMLAALFSTQPAILTAIQTYKGLIYVGLTSLLLYVLLNGELQKRQRQSELLQKREQDFRLLFLNNPQPMWVYELATLRFLEVNLAATQQYGYTREEFISMTLQDIRPPGEISRLLEDIEKPREALQKSSFWKHRTKAGTLIDVEIISHTLIFEGKASVLVIALDITEWKQAQRDLERTERHLQHILQNMDDVVWSFDMQTGEMIYHSSKTESIYGYTHKALGSDQNLWIEAVHPDDFQLFLEGRLIVDGGGSRDVEYRIIHPDGDIRWLRDRAWAVHDEDGEIIRIDGITSDITANKALQKDTLEMEQLRLALNKEIELRNLRDRFMSMVSHEFRNPLTTITSSAGLLQMYHDRLEAEKREKHLEKIQNQVRLLTGMLDDILIILRNEALGPKFQAEALDVVALCQDILVIMQQNDKGQHTFQFKCKHNSLILEGDRKLLRHAFENLLSNAAKYSPDGGDIIMELRESGELICLSVTDQGIGIPAAEREKLFSAFHRASNVGMIQGSGLGLAITKQAVELHHGKIALESIVGEGTTFTIYLPKVPKPDDAGNTLDPISNSE